MKIYQVGGAVRDKLLGKSCKDKDWVVVGATPEAMLAQGFTQVGKDFPVFLHPETHEEYALARTERKIGSGYTGFQVHSSSEVTLEEDLCRRDLTINAIAEDKDGQLIDPFQGKADLEAGILRHVSPAFIEDPVRILRIARFAARFDFAIADETMDLMCDMVIQGEVDALVVERVWQETVKALSEPKPQLYFSILRQCGALARIFPEIDRLFGIPQPATHHPEIDTGQHTLLCLQQVRELTSDSEVLFAVLTHDLGKGNTPTELLPRHIGHEERGVNLIKQLSRRCRVPSHYRDLAIIVARYHLHCHKAFELTSKTLLKVLESTDAFRRPQRFEQFLLACEADARGRKGFEDRAYPQANFWRQLLVITQKITIADILEKGVTGNIIGIELHKRRLLAIKQFKSDSE